MVFRHGKSDGGGAPGAEFDCNGIRFIPVVKRPCRKPGYDIGRGEEDEGFDAVPTVQMVYAHD